jgi:PIN domain nuclease of toxin-antitoxin system
MISVVADTHAIVWHLTDPARLGRGARRAFSAIDAGRWLCHIPMIALVEIWLLHERSRLRLGPAQFLEAIAGHPGYALLSLDTAQAMEFGALPRIRDPLDRLILAAARATQSRLLSADEAFEGHGVERLWD